MVVFGHAPDFGLPSLFDSGSSHCGVLIFFALSGFLMGDLYIFASPRFSNILAYGVARFARIVPIYYFIIIAAFIVYRLDPDFVWPMSLLQLFRHLTFNGSISVFWSIGPEVQFYFVFVGLWLLRDRLRRDAAFASLMIGCSAICLITIHRWPGVFVASKFHIFAGGMLAALLRPRLIRFISPTSLVIGHMIGFAILVLFLAPELSHQFLGVTPFDRQSDPAFSSFYGSLPRISLAIFLVLAFSFDQPITHWIFANRLASLVGQCSFSIYLLHIAVYDIATHSILSMGAPAWLTTLAIVILTLAVSLLIHHMIERPLHRGTRRILTKMLRRSAAPSMNVA